MSSWVLASRPKTLIAAIAPIIAATSLAFSAGHSLSPLIVTLCFFCALLLQISTNLINDGADFESGADNEERRGPDRAAQLGLLTPRQLYLGAGVCLILTFAIGLYLSWIGGWPIFLAGILSILFAVLYTKGPYPLAYHGLGDLFVLVFFGLVAVNGVYFLLTKSLNVSSFIVGTIIGLTATLIMIANNTRDIETDKKAKKHTLSLIVGEQLSKRYYSAVVAVICVLFFFALNVAVGNVSWISIVATILIGGLGIALSREFISASTAEEYNACLEYSAKYLLFLSLLLSASFLAIGSING